MADKNCESLMKLLISPEKTELANVLSMELTKFSIYDIMKISGGLDREISRLPSPYREKSHPYFVEQFFGRYTKTWQCGQTAIFMLERTDSIFESIQGILQYREQAY